MAVDETTRLAETLLALRHARSDDLPPEMFAETGWEILLQLFVADARGLSMSAGDLSIKTSAASATCQRWLRYLAAKQLITGDFESGADRPILPSAKALEAVEHWLATVKAAFESRWGARFDDVATAEKRS